MGRRAIEGFSLGKMKLCGSHQVMYELKGSYEVNSSMSPVRRHLGPLYKNRAETCSPKTLQGKATQLSCLRGPSTGGLEAHKKFDGIICTNSWLIRVRSVVFYSSSMLPLGRLDFCGGRALPQVFSRWRGILLARMTFQQSTKLPL